MGLNYLRSSKTHSVSISFNSKRLLLTCSIRTKNCGIVSTYRVFYTLQLSKNGLIKINLEQNWKEQEAIFSVNFFHLIGNKKVNNRK